MAIFAGRYSGTIDGDFVVFLIGMRINKPWKVHRWLPVFLAMPRMLRELERDPASGFLGATAGILNAGPVVVQYWRSFDDLDRFARDTNLPHLEPWRRFNRLVRASGDVGIWHETFRVRAGEYESIYSNMPVFGLGAAAGHMPASSKADTAAARIGATTTDEPVVEPY